MKMLEMLFELIDLKTLVVIYDDLMSYFDDETDADPGDAYRATQVIRYLDSVARDRYDMESAADLTAAYHSGALT